MSSIVTLSPGISNHAVVPLDIAFDSSIKRGYPIKITYFHYQRNDWDSLHDFPRDNPWNEMFKLPI